MQAPSSQQHPIASGLFGRSDAAKGQCSSRFVESWGLFLRQPSNRRPQTILALPVLLRTRVFVRVVTKPSLNTWARVLRRWQPGSCYASA